jgi:hypothetical protein
MTLGIFPPYHGRHTRDVAPGAMPNGSRVRKVASEPCDTHQDGALATVLGSMHAPGIGFGYFVAFDDHPLFAVFVAGHRCEEANDG